MNADVRDLLARQAVTDVLHRYCRAMDRIDRALALTCWHEGATVDYGDAFRGGAADFVEWVCRVHEDVFVAHSHQITNVALRLTDDRAASESYVTVALRTRGDGAGEQVDIVGRGRYLDRWSCRDGTWAIEHRQHVTDLQQVRPATGLAGAVPARRDRSDPSYDVLG